MSTASHIPSHQQAPTSHAARNNHKRTRPSAHTAHENHNGSLLDQTVARREMFHTAPSSSATHPSLPLPYGGGNGNPYEHIPQLPLPSHTEWTPAPTQLEGPGMPVARGASLTHTGMPITAPIVVPQPQQPPQPPAPGEEDGEGEVDNKVYCFCQTVSYGEMIGCDDMDCPHEWVCFVLVVYLIFVLTVSTVPSLVRRARRDAAWLLVLRHLSRKTGAKGSPRRQTTRWRWSWTLRREGCKWSVKRLYRYVSCISGPPLTSYLAHASNNGHMLVSILLTQYLRRMADCSLNNTRHVHDI